VKLAFAALSIFVTACGFVKPLGSDSDSQGSSSSQSSTTDPGVDCGKDPESGVTLCLGTKECADTMLDLDAFPGCGLKSTHDTYDLECVCNGNALCPVGVASSCDELAGLLTHRTIADICNQAGDGACTEVGQTQATPAPTHSATCDQGCAAECEGAASCIQMCGC
jgi:hypothetical protein